jgi:hypothetical protein
MPLTELAAKRVDDRQPSALREGVVDDPVTDDEGFLRVVLDGQEYTRSCVWTPTDPEPEPGYAVGVLESDNGNLHAVTVWPQ